jgi:magnesium-transporting ATPase (P-type)
MPICNSGSDHTGRYVPSSELVPGDVYEVTDPSLTQFPCDSILLAGDCIVNESMLTGNDLSLVFDLHSDCGRRVCTCIQSTSQ